MRQFEFNGIWNPLIELPEFGKLNQTDLITKFHKADNLFSINIEDYHDYNPDPIDQQLNSINYIIDNEFEILNSIYLFIKNEVYPKYRIFMSIDEYPECYPTLNNVRDLRELLALSEILLYTISKDEFSYSVFCFNSRLDYGHGLCITMHKSSCITWAEMGNLDQEKIVEDDGKINVAVYQEDKQLFKGGLFLPHPKYDKLKPWQIKSNKELPNRLLGEDKVFELKEYLITKADKETVENLIRLCLWWNKDQTILEYLLTLNKCSPFISMEIAVEKRDFNLVKYLFINAVFK